jgi:hypothetical protein
MRVLPAKGLVDENGDQTTTYAILHRKKPRIGRFNVFGCPCVFKKYQPRLDGKASTHFKQLQRGSRGIFVGFPDNQAGWLIYVPEKIGGTHLIVSSDVSFDQYFLSCPQGVEQEFANSQTVRNVGKSGGRHGQITEATGDITNITDPTTSHWGTSEVNTFDSEHQLNNNKFADPNNQFDILNTQLPDDDSSESEPDSDLDGPVVSSDDLAGSTTIDGVRRSQRLVNSYDKKAHGLMLLAREKLALQELETEHIFSTLLDIANQDGVDISPYLPEPKNYRQVMQCQSEVQKAWLKAVYKEMKFLIENGTFKRGEKPNPGDEIIPAIVVFKAKITSKGYLDKLKARCVARGDLQQKSAPEETWAPYVFSRTFKMFICMAVRHLRIIKQLDFIGAFCQGNMQKRLFLQLPKEYVPHFSQFKTYFDSPMLLEKSIYGTNFAHKVFSDDLTEWLLKNDEMNFTASELDSSLFVHRSGEDFVYLICYVDDCLYFGSSDKIEEKMGEMLKRKFKLELQGHAHWFLGTRIYREQDGSYIIDQETYAKHILTRYCGEDTHWGLPPM